MPDPAARAIPAAWPLAMRVERAAACLDVSPTYFREHIAPALPAIRRGPGMILYRLADIQAWLDQQVPGGAALEENNPWLQP